MSSSGNYWAGRDRVRRWRAEQADELLEGVMRVHRKEMASVATITSPPLTKEGLLDSLESLARRLKDGCGNHGCCIKKPVGQATNGGCSCTPRHAARELRQLAEAVERTGVKWNS